MASYKVAQDVEADDKLLGPFSFRQFIYLIIAVMCGILAWGLAQVFVPLAIIPVPIILFFLAIALPLRKDQPMEVYFAAIVSYYIKPKRRLWEPDGVQSLVEITVPVDNEVQRTKDLSSTETERRLEYLSVLADTQGWSVRNAPPPKAYNTPLNKAVYQEAKNDHDSFDEGGTVSQSFDTMIDRSDEARRAAIIERLHNPTAQPQAAQPAPASAPTTAQLINPVSPQPTTSIQPQPAPVVDPLVAAATSTPQSMYASNFGTANYSEPATATTQNEVSSPEDLAVSFNPYPTAMRQRVLPTSGQPTNEPAPPPIPTPEPVSAPDSLAESAPDNSTSEIRVSPDIIKLANNTDLSVETIAREAHRIEQKSQDSEEVVISLH